eukprot:c32156_g1_i1.p1 GENE.c32156_g1_i1~~c32156_g1_i1.p1  ORF type:complete len:459 (+),score=83.94 c32156_g1_i1:33-1379(+)
MSPDGSYVASPWRWLILTSFCLSTATNAIIWISFAPIAHATAKYYNISTTQVDVLSVLFLILYVPGSVLAAALFHSRGLRFGLLFGNSLTCLGAWIRFASAVTGSHPLGGSDSKLGFGLLLLGQFLAGIGQPCFTNMPALVASDWFPISQRDMAVVLASMFNVVGIAVGQFIPTLFVKESGDGMFTLLLIEGITATVVLLFALPILRDHPPTPPSRSKDRSSHNRTERESVSDMLRSLWLDVRACLTNKDFLVLFVAFGSGLGLFNAMATLISQLVKPSGYNDDDAGIFGVALIGSGLLLSGVVGVVMDQTHYYRTIFKMLFICSIGASFLLLFMLKPDNNLGLTIGFAAAGGFMMPLLPVALECAVECTFPISEDVSGGLLIASGNVSGIVFIFGLAKLIELRDHYVNIWAPATCAMVGVVTVLALLSLLYRGKYLRLQAEQPRLLA